MPTGAIIRHVAVQNGIVCVWAEVDPDAPIEVRTFEIFGTGWNNINGTYIATYFAGPFVWHLYEVTK